MTASRTASHPTSYREALTQIIGLCNTILERQSKEAKVDDLQKKITENMPDRCEGVAQQKTLRECKVLIKKVHQSFCRINGGAVTELQLEISDVLPLKTIDALFDVEEKLQSNEYKEEMISYIFTLGAATGNIDGTIKKMFSDELLINFNWDGRCGKRALMKLNAVEFK
ncbi:uncharacterized protein LOC118751729 [Rhagoletis pomonella]|uniref:uncharacterized protein LOC118751729 n=1 Tax=Rhagoletis pomonella TaxID=28610 RepID=UPI00177B1CAE|nr:uncharacterized protein LOC118751729 [Rhagoletis pomonella]